jgi:FkbM family methyltransferase
MVQHDINANSKWVVHLDPNKLRRKNVSLPPLFCDVEDTFGARYNVNVNDHIGWHLFVKGYFDPVPTLVVRLLRQLGREGALVDGGANIGSTCIPAALDGVEVFAVEASNSTCAELVKNFALNPSIHATAVNAALCSPAQLAANRYSEIFRSEGNFAAGSLFENWNNSGTSGFKEYALNTTLDRIVEFHRIDKILMVKLDIEGYEFYALEGFQRSLSTMRPPVMFEWRPDHLLKTLGRIDDVRTLFPKGYRFFSIHPRRFAAADDSWQFGIQLRETNLEQISENVIALPEDAVPAYVLDQLTQQHVAIPG